MTTTFDPDGLFNDSRTRKNVLAASARGARIYEAGEAKRDFRKGFEEAYAGLNLCQVRDGSAAYYEGFRAGVKYATRA